MKHIKIFLGAAAIFGLALTSCDEVSVKDRFEEAEIDPQRAVLIEEFTGQSCTNCPDGHLAIKDLVASLGDSVVPVSIHASSLAMDPPRGYKTEQGEEMYRAVGSPVLPTAIINKQTSPLQVSNWGSAIDRIIMTATPFTVIAHPTINTQDNTYDIKVDFSSGNDFTGKLSVWVVENNIIGRQLDHGTWINDYVHNHVFRTAANGTWGEDVELKANEPQHVSYRVAINPLWNMDNVYVVAFLYNNAGVAQVTQTSSH